MHCCVEQVLGSIALEIHAAQLQGGHGMLVLAASPLHASRLHVACQAQQETKTVHLAWCDTHTHDSTPTLAQSDTVATCQTWAHFGNNSVPTWSCSILRGSCLHFRLLCKAVAACGCLHGRPHLQIVRVHTSTRDEAHCHIEAWCLRLICLT